MLLIGTGYRYVKTHELTGGSEDHGRDEKSDKLGSAAFGQLHGQDTGTTFWTYGSQFEMNYRNTLALN